MKYPVDYEPVADLYLCSNVFRHVRVPLAVRGSPILLIGVRDIPLVWLATPPSVPGGDPQYFVKASKPLSSWVQVFADGGTKSVSISSSGIPVLTAYTRNGGTVYVDQLDLRPLGIDVYGRSDALFVGGSQLCRNTFQNMGTAIDLSLL